MSLATEKSNFNEHEVISKGSCYGVGSLIRVQACSASVAVSGVPRLFFAMACTAQNTFQEWFLQQANFYNEQEYFVSFKQGDEKGFAYYFHAFYHALHFFAIGIVKDPTLAEDVVEESFLKLYEKRGTIQSSDTIRSFLYTTVRNACIDKMRQQKNRAAHHHQLSYLLNDPEKTIDEHLIRTETYAQVLAAIEELPTAVRKVVKLYYIEGKDSSEIAAELNRSKETVRKQKHHGLVFLRKRLSGLQIFLLIFFLHTHLF